MRGRSATRQPWPHARPAYAYAQLSCHRTRSLWGGGAACSLAARARHATRVGIGPPALQGRHANDRALLFGARSWWYAPALASSAAGCACAQESGHRTRSLSVGGAAGALAARARHAALVRIDPPALESRRASARALSFDARPWRYAPALASRAAGLRICARERSPHALYVGRRRSMLACLARAPRRVGWNWASSARRPPR